MKKLKEDLSSHCVPLFIQRKKKSTFVSPVPFLPLLSGSSVPPVSPISSRLTSAAMDPRGSRNTGLSRAQTGRDLVVLQLAGQMHVQCEQ